MALHNSMNHFSLLSQQVNEIGSKVCIDCWFKVPICFIIAAIGFLFGVHNGSLLIGLVVLIIFDTILGIGAAYTEGRVIESRRALKAATKLAVYAVLASSAYMVESIVPSSTFIDEAMISFLALTEFISIMENAGRMGFTVPQRLLNRLQDLRGTK